MYALYDEILGLSSYLKGKAQGLPSSLIDTSENIQKVKELLNQNKPLTSDEAVYKAIQLQKITIIQQETQNKMDAMAEKLLVECVVMKESDEFDQTIDPVKWSRDNSAIAGN